MSASNQTPLLIAAIRLARGGVLSRKIRSNRLSVDSGLTFEPRLSTHRHPEACSDVDLSGKKPGDKKRGRASCFEKVENPSFP